MQIKRDYYLDFIKVIATICIVFHHYQQVTGAFFENRLNFNGGIFYFGYIVELFFVISGCVMIPYIKRIQDGLEFPSFFLKRFIRLFPLMLIGAIAYEIFLTIYESIYQGSWFGINVTFWGTVIASLGIQEGWGLTNPSVNNPTWYISVLLLCYIIFYITTYLGKRWKIPVQYLYIFIIFLGMGIITYGINLPFLNSQAARGYYAFFFGILLGEFMKKRECTNRMAIMLLCVIIIITLLIMYRNNIMASGINYIMTYIYYPAIIMIGKHPLIASFFNKRWMGTLGKISFDVYIWHNPFYLLLYIFIKVFSWNINLDSMRVMVLYTGVCFIWGIVSHYCIEKPISRVLDKKCKLFN